MFAPQWLVLGWNKARAVVLRFQRERDMDDEMRFHVEMEAAELRRAGVPPDEALRRARAAFGGVERHKEDARDAVGIRLLDDLAQDLRYATRRLRATPGFTGATVLTLALGIGATTTMYTLNAALTTTQTSFPRASELVHVAQGTGGSCNACWRLAKGNYITIRDESRTLTGVSLIANWSAILRGPERGEAINAARVTPAFFEMLGVPALLGRTISAADSAPDRRNAVIVLSEEFWRARLGGDSTIIGRTIVLDAAPRTVIGVVAQPHVFPQGTAAWGPLVLGPADAADRSWTDDNTIARLRPGVSVEQARVELATIGARVAKTFPATMHGWTFDAMSFAAWQRPRGGDEFWMLTTAVALLLTIACINLAGLLIARLTVRRKEIAVRAAMGADGPRIARQLLTETVVLTLISGALGGAVAVGVTRIIRDALPSSVTASIPNWSTMRVDTGAFLIALATGVLTGIIIGLWPALRFARPSLVGELKAAARSATTLGTISRARRALVVAQTAFAIVLLAGAGLLARSLRNLHTVHPGFRTDHVLTMRVNAPPRAPDDKTPIDSLRYDRLAATIGRLPGVVRAAAVFGLPYGHIATTYGFTIAGRPPAAGNKEISVQMIPVTPDYFATLEIPVVRGRAFTASDRSGAPRVTIIDQTIARRHFANEDPIGRLLVMDSLPWQIVGVVGDARYNARGRSVAMHSGEVYRPSAQWPRRSMQLVVRTRDDPSSMAEPVMHAVGALDRDLAVTRVAPMEMVIAEDVAADKLLAGMMSGFALAAVLITTIGLYGLISYAVAQRTREFGIRRALGAEARALAALVLGQGLRLAALGAAIGSAVALAVMRLMRALLFGVSPADPLTLVAVASAMCAIGVAAAYAPARRATRVDPMLSLREE